MNKFKRSTVLPVILFFYLCIMAWFGLKGLKTGETSPTTYFLTIGVTLGLIVVLHFFLKRREKLARERREDINNNDNNNESIN